MSLFNKNSETVPAQQAVVISEGQLLVVGKRAYKAELFGLIEVPVKTLEQQKADRQAEQATQDQ